MRVIDVLTIMVLQALINLAQRSRAMAVRADKWIERKIAELDRGKHGDGDS